MIPRRKVTRLLLLAAGLHLMITVVIYVSGRHRLSSLIDQNGCTITITPDCNVYVPDVRSLAEVMTSQGLLTWLKTPAQLPLRIYSLPAAILGSWLGVNSLTVEPVNIFYYLAILCVTFQIGKLVFDWRVGLIAAGVLGIWPSFLIHTTQILKDPLFIVTFLALVLLVTVWLTRQLNLLKGIATAGAGVGFIYIISLARSGFWGAIVLAILILGVSLLLLRQLREKKFLPINIASALLVVLASVLVNHQAPEEFESNQVQVAQAAKASAGPAAAPPKQRINLPAIRLSELRQGWLSFNRNAGSNIDGDVEFETIIDVIRYLPRAWAIGFLAPFPNHWLARGRQVGLSGRLFSGFEMLLTYIVELLALFGLWRARSNLGAWLLVGAVVIGITALALAVINLGTLYRFRYAFLILLLILGVNGLLRLLASFKPEFLSEMKRRIPRTLAFEDK